MGFLRGSVVKDMPANGGDLGSIPGLGRSPGEGNGNPLQCSLSGKSHRQRSLAGYRPWGCKESDMTEHTDAFATLIFFLALSRATSFSFFNAIVISLARLNESSFLKEPIIFH